MNKRIGFPTLLYILISFSFISSLQAQHSVAREWNETVLHAIRNDFARPTVHARNLFHSSAAMYDLWAVYDQNAQPFFLGNRIGAFEFSFDGIPQSNDIKAAREEAMSYAVYRLIYHRFQRSPGVFSIYGKADSLMRRYGYDPGFTSTDYSGGNPAALGNYYAEQMIEFGRQDGAREQWDYENQFYEPLNPRLVVEYPGNPDIVDPNRWQPLTLQIFIDQAGNPIPFNTPPFLSPEWGRVIPFSLSFDDRIDYTRGGFGYPVYYDPGPPPYLDTTRTGGLSEEYKWGFSLVSVWASHLDPGDSVMWDISPATIGNISAFPDNFEDYRSFYKLIEGGDPSLGHSVNPVTGQAYEAQMVPRADYARVLAEFWADGPDSETPPGHWFTILNYVNDHPMFARKYRGMGSELDPLEWDVKAYFMLGGTMHDVAISAWGIKGYYDYIRPISAIRAMAEFGQSSDSTLDNYHPAGLPLIPGYIEIATASDTALLGADAIGKIKLYTWKGPYYINNPETDLAGVGWILADNWYPYQRPSFVTPPFAGYVSGHSTYSRAAAEFLTLLTGDEFFPGGMGTFIAKKNEFLVFEEGPSQDIELQWATYRDASDQTSLSRIWGGIHPPADDIPGRIIGEQIGIKAFEFAEQYFNLSSVNNQKDIQSFNMKLWPNPIEKGQTLQLGLSPEFNLGELRISDLQGRIIYQQQLTTPYHSMSISLPSLGIASGVYSISLTNGTQTTIGKLLVR